MHVSPKRELTGSNAGRFGLGLLGVIALTALFAPLLAGYDPLQQTASDFLAPSAAHLLGTNHVGQDIFSQLVYGARTSLLVGFAAAALATLLGTLVGAASAIVGGLFDRIVMRFVDALIVIPILVVLILIAAYLKPSLWLLIVMLSLLGWQGGARIVRAQTLSLKQELHIAAARCFGAGRWYIIRRHILPDLGPILLAELIYGVRRAVFMEAGLAFIGIADPNVVSWGMMMKEALDFSYMDAWLWWLIPAGAALSATIIAITFIGHSLEPAMDPRLKVEANA